MSMSTLIAPGQRAEFRRGDLIRMRSGNIMAAGEDEPRGTIKGTGCVYGVEVDRGGGWLFLQLEPGCFAAQVPYASRVLVLWQHQDGSPIGKLSALEDSAERLRYVGRITENQDVPDARKALALLREGEDGMPAVIEQVSVGFRMLKWIREESDDGEKVLYRITEAHLEEISVVTFGALGDAATVEDVWSRGTDVEGLAGIEVRARAAKARAELERAQLRLRMAGAA